MTVTTKSDQEFKADGGKTQPDLLEQGFPRALRIVQATLDYGKKKYEAHSWQKVPDGLARYNSAARRHRQARDLEALPADDFHAVLEATDEESGLPHIAHEVVCLLMMIELDLAANVDITAANNTLSALISRMKEPPTAHKAVDPAQPPCRKSCETCKYFYDGLEPMPDVCQTCWPPHYTKPTYDMWKPR